MYYEVGGDSEDVVFVLAVGVKERNQVRIGFRGIGAMKLKKVDIAKSEQAIHESLAQPEITPLVITRRGKGVAALIPLNGADWETVARSLDPKFQAIIEKSRASLRTEGGVPDEIMEGRFR